MFQSKYNYLLKIEYDGSKFVGWQYQKNGKSIQDTIEKAISKLLKSKTRIVGAGRTDKGVHAVGQFANFVTKKKIDNEKKFLNSLNFFLRKDFISILEIKRKNLKFHSRFSAKERIYEYRIINRESELSLNRNKAWHIKNKLDSSLLKKGIKILEGTHDFSTFRSASCSANSPVRTINYVRLKKKGDEIVITFNSRSFLQNQVRSMVGCLKYLSCNQWSLKKFKSALNSKKRSKCAPPAPACGLYLHNIKY